MPDFIDCPVCVDGWIGNEHCRECDGTGEVEEDQWYIGADLLYDGMKDDLLTD